MRSCKAFVILLAVAFAEANSKVFLQAILKPKGNFFTTINKNMQSLINNIFSTLKLPDEFSNRLRVKSLLKMHYDMNNIAENYYNNTIEMKALAEVYVKHVPGDKIKLNEIITEAIKENGEFSTVENLISNNRYSLNTSVEETTKIDSTETWFDDSQEFLKFVRNFVTKLNTLGDEDLYGNEQIDGKDFLPSTETENVWNGNEEIDNIEEIEGVDDSFWEPSASIEDDINTNGSRRIFGGHRSTNLKYPFMVSVWVLSSFMGGGSVIASDLIITAASCIQLIYNNRFYRENPRGVFVRVGTKFLTKQGEIISVNEVYFHPNYNPKTLANNLAILRLKRHLRFQSKVRRIKRIELDDNPAPLSSNINGVIILGWGAQSRSQIINLFAQLMVEKLHIYQLQDCRDVYSEKFITQKNFCAGFLASGGGACSRDVGGPGVLDRKLVGVISFGSPMCGTPDSPTVFTKVGYYKNWINMIINKKPPTGGQLTTKRPRRTKPHYWTRSTFGEENYVITPVNAKGNGTVFVTTEMTNAPFMPTLPHPKYDWYWEMTEATDKSHNNYNHWPRPT